MKDREKQPQPEEKRREQGRKNQRELDRIPEPGTDALHEGP